MKSLILSITLGLASTNAFAMSKTCLGANNDNNTKGGKLTAQITQQSVDIADGDFAGKYPFNKKADTVAGKDGRTYLQYDVPDGSDGCNTLLVDENLLKAKGKGWIKLRCTGEGFGDTKYFCKP